MKKLISIVLTVLMVFSIALAETDLDLASMTNEELLALRLAVNNELASRNAEQISIEEGMTIAEIFPDVWVSRTVRDKLGKFSTHDVVTQEELDTITSLKAVNQDDLSTLEGIQYLRNLNSLYVSFSDYLTEIPEEIGSLTLLRDVTFRTCDSLTSVPDTICNLINLKKLALDYTSISSLPDDIGNLTNLEKLDISHTKITELPASIYNLKLQEFGREGLDID